MNINDIHTERTALRTELLSLRARIDAFEDEYTTKNQRLNKLQTALNALEALENDE
jgi:uncharacterized protein involved in exopolysaccharide biosynthesis